MSKLTRIFRWLYTQSLNLYPADFRINFSDEMQTVFSQAIAEHTRDGNGKTMVFYLREIRDFPGSLLRQHWSAIKKEVPPMIPVSETNGQNPSKPVSAEREPGTWGASTLAGLPHLLMGLLIGAGKLGIFDIYQVSQTSTAIIGIGLALLVMGMLFFAWRHSWPLWSASWYLYGTWVVLAILGLGLESLNLEGSWRYTNAIFLGWILLCIVGYFIILSKSKLHGVLSVAFLFPFLGIMFLEFIPNPIEGWMAIGLGLLTALTIGAIIRLGEFLSGLWLVLGVNLIAGLSLAYVGEYQIKDLPPNIPAHIPKFGNFLELMMLYSIFGMGIVALPFLLRGLWNFARRKLT
jgi:hypothetical protein